MQHLYALHKTSVCISMSDLFKVCLTCFKYIWPVWPVCMTSFKVCMTWLRFLFSLFLLPQKTFIKRLDSSRGLTNFIIFFISLLHIISVVATEPEATNPGALDPKILLWIPAYAADAAVVYPNANNTPLANNVSTFLMNGNLTFSNGLRSLPKNPSNSIILNSRLFDNSLSFDELFPIAENYFYHYLSCLTINL